MQVVRHPMKWLQPRLPGLSVAVALAVAAWFIAAGLAALDVTVVEALVLALIGGMIVRLRWQPPAILEPGLSFAAKGLLEIAIVLLGASLSFTELGTAGLKLIGYAFLTVGLVLALGLVLGERLGLGRRLSALVAVGNAICGNSAIAAVAPILRATQQEIASAIALTAALSVGVVLLLPLTAPLFDMTDAQYGVLAGLVVYAVPQVVAASFAVSTESGDIGSLVKLLRVLAIGPVVAGAAYLVARSAVRDVAGSSSGNPPRLTLSKAVPWFVAGFLCLAVLRTIGVLPQGLGDAARESSRLLTIVAMAALGLTVDLASVRQSGRAVATLVLALTLFSIALGLVLVKAFGV
jgi:uncharacterized integral membrane protein (TIGR00698 family)